MCNSKAIVITNVSPVTINAYLNITAQIKVVSNSSNSDGREMYTT